MGLGAAGPQESCRSVWVAVPPGVGPGLRAGRLQGRRQVLARCLGRPCYGLGCGIGLPSGAGAPALFMPGRCVGGVPLGRHLRWRPLQVGGSEPCPDVLIRRLLQVGELRMRLKALCQIKDLCLQSGLPLLHVPQLSVIGSHMTLQHLGLQRLPQLPQCLNEALDELHGRLGAVCVGGCWAAVGLRNWQWGQPQHAGLDNLVVGACEVPSQRLYRPDLQIGGRPMQCRTQRAVELLDLFHQCRLDHFAYAS
mmetsp:Transcript_104395/g.179889  ORF Transcript_104395/g.179889 Transcript_104395/m.179889 type:complete len:251 (+) Transcript_104395:477-1229(+)